MVFGGPQRFVCLGDAAVMGIDFHGIALAACQTVYCGKPNFADLSERGEFGPTCVWFLAVRKDLFAWGMLCEGINLAGWSLQGIP
jgi:hypothetical protein